MQILKKMLPLTYTKPKFFLSTLYEIAKPSIAKRITEIRTNPGSIMSCP
jgi:hypothetical protein